MGGSAGAFLALGMGPLATAPAAHADPLDAILDPIINSLASALPSAVDPLAGLDLASLSLPATDLAGTSGLVGSVDSALVLPTEPLAAVGSSADPSALGSLDPLSALGSLDPLSALGSLDPLSALGSLDPLSALGSSAAPAGLLDDIEQAWITNPVGELFDNSINTATGEFLIGNGLRNADAIAAAGGAGGLWFGDGGAGYDAALNPGVGGTAGMAGGRPFGDGGVGGEGGADADGGAGGDGGTLIGIGGTGGQGGVGVDGSRRLRRYRR